jgi:hypothetical protein
MKVKTYDFYNLLMKTVLAFNFEMQRNISKSLKLFSRKYQYHKETNIIFYGK